MNIRAYKPIRCIWKENGCLEHLQNSLRGWICRDGKNITLHRWIFFLNNGFLPEVVMHTCDNLKCINPLHLKAGTFKENSEDMVNKKRQAYGERNGGNKLKEMQVREIKQLIPKLSLNQIAKKYNISKKMVLLIKQGKKWKYV